MGKPFKTVQEQIEILRSRGMVVDEAYAAPILLRENYYSIVNGYKDPFLDRVAMQSSPNDVYQMGTQFVWLADLFKFDRELRGLTFGYLLQAESALKTATVYGFCSHHQVCTDYLDRDSFVDARNMLFPKSFTGNMKTEHSRRLSRLLSLLNDKQVIKKGSMPFVVHYLQTYGEVPLWVLANDLTFGNMAHFFQLMKRADQNLVCKVLFQTTLRGKGEAHITPHEVLRAYEVLVYFRNMCAHDERLYCAQKNGDGYASIFEVLNTALPNNTVTRFKNELVELVNEYAERLHCITVDEMKAMLGITQVRGTS